MIQSIHVFLRCEELEGKHMKEVLIFRLNRTYLSWVYVFRVELTEISAR